MQTQTKANFQNEWVKILSKGLITIPKVFREELRLNEGEIARIKKVGRRLIIEPREVAEYETYSDKELKRMLKEDKLPANLAKKAASLWPDLV
jgi:AbrB family looped-hinge helix DNA binding protein